MRSLIAVLLLACCVVAQEASQPSPATGPAQPNTATPAPASPATVVSCAKGALQAAALDAVTADCLMGPIQQGLVTHNSRQILAVFDKKQFEGYFTFQDQLDALFERYETIRAFYKIGAIQAEGDHATVLVDFDVEEVGRGGAYAPIRKHQQVRFEMMRGDKGWKVTDYTPRGFFS